MLLWLFLIIKKLICYVALILRPTFIWNIYHSFHQFLYHHVLWIVHLLTTFSHMFSHLKFISHHISGKIMFYLVLFIFLCLLEHVPVPHQSWSRMRGRSWIHLMRRSHRAHQNLISRFYFPPNIVGASRPVSVFWQALLCKQLCFGIDWAVKYFMFGLGFYWEMRTSVLTVAQREEEEEERDFPLFLQTCSDLSWQIVWIHHWLFF